MIYSVQILLITVVQILLRWVKYADVSLWYASFEVPKIFIDSVASLVMLSWSLCLCTYVNQQEYLHFPHYLFDRFLFRYKEGRVESR